MEPDLQWLDIRTNENIQNLYTDDAFPWVLRDALADTLLEASLDETKVSDKVKVMQSLQDLCKQQDPKLEEVFQNYTNQFEKKSQPYTLLKKIITAERKIIRSLENVETNPPAQVKKEEKPPVHVKKEDKPPVETKKDEDAMDVDNPIYQILKDIKGNVSQLPH